MPDGGPRVLAISTARPFDELFEARPLRGIRRGEVSGQGCYPVVDQSEGVAAGWSDDEQRAYAGALPALVFCDHTRRLKLLERPFVPVGEGLVVLHPRGELDPAYAFHLLRAVVLPDRGYARHFGLLRARRFDVPSLERQRALAARLARAQECLAGARSKLDGAAALVHELERATVAGGLACEGESWSFDRCFDVHARKGTARLEPEGRFLVVDQNPERSRGRTDDGDRLVADTPVIVFGDHTRCVQWVDEPFVPASDGVKVLRARDGLDLRYGYWLLRSVTLRDDGYARHLRQLRRREFVVPAMERQRELALDLDEASARVHRMRRRVAQARATLEAYETTVSARILGKGPNR